MKLVTTQYWNMSVLKKSIHFSKAFYCVQFYKIVEYFQAIFILDHFGFKYAVTQNQWYITSKFNTNKGKCLGFAFSNLNTDKCVHEIGFFGKFVDGSVWADAAEGLSVKCLYEPGNY